MATNASAEAIPLGLNTPIPLSAAKPRLSDKINDLIGQIVGLAEIGGDRVDGEPVVCPTRPASLAEVARRIYAQRRRRNRHLPADMFREPAWDIMLDLFIAAEEGRRIPVTSACIAADVPSTTGLRWLQVLETRGFIDRRADPNDGRRTYVALSVAGYTAMANYLASEIKAVAAK